MNILQRMLQGTVKKALYDLHPELEDRIPLMRLYSDEQATMAGSGLDLDYYATNTWVHKAVKVIRDAVSQLDVYPVDVEGQPIPSNPLYERLQNPNPNQSPGDLWSEWVVQMMLGGELGMEVVWGTSGKKPLELWPRAGKDFSVLVESTRYRRISGYKVDDGDGNPYNLTPAQMVHFRFYNPANPWRGLAPISAVRMGVVIDQLAQAWVRLFYKNQARPDLAVVAPEGITQSERRELEERLVQQHGGDNAWRPIVLEQGVTDIKVFSYPPKDMEWVTQREMSRDEIGAIFGVPDELMGYGKDTYENFNTADRVLWTMTIVPIVKLRDSALTLWARRNGLLQPTERVETDLAEVPQLQEDRSQKVIQMSTLAGLGYPVNVLNEWLGLDLPDVPGGDVGYRLGVVPVATPNTEQRLATTAAVRKQVSYPEYGSEEHVKILAKKAVSISQYVLEMQSTVKREFQRQQNEVGRKLRESRSFGRGQYKDVKQLPPVTELFDYDEEVEAFMAALRSIVRRAIAALGQAALAEVVAGRLFDITNPIVQAGIETVLRTVAEKVNNTTWLNLIELFQAAEEAGEGIPAMQERLSLYFGDRKSDYQTERIARTTMNGASNFADVEGWQQSGVVDEHTWISALQPDRSRDEHMAAHGQTVKLGESFIVGGESLKYPGDPAGSAGNIINCLCTTVAKVKQQ